MSGRVWHYELRQWLKYSTPLGPAGTSPILIVSGQTTAQLNGTCLRPARHDPFGHLYRRPIRAIVGCKPRTSRTPRTATHLALLASSAPAPNAHHPHFPPLRPPHVHALACCPCLLGPCPATTDLPWSPPSRLPFASSSTPAPPTRISRDS
jgi:hypothetical protein